LTPWKWCEHAGGDDAAPRRGFDAADFEVELVDLEAAGEEVGAACAVTHDGKVVNVPALASVVVAVFRGGVVAHTVAAVYALKSHRGKTNIMRIDTATNIAPPRTQINT
jgi:hypothetical protein